MSTPPIEKSYESNFEILIDSPIEETEQNMNTFCVIRVENKHHDSWRASRSWPECCKFLGIAQSENPSFEPSYVPELEQPLELSQFKAYFHQFYSLSHGRVWNSKALLSFLDNEASASPLVSMKIQSMETQMSDLVRQLSYTTTRLESIEQLANTLQLTLNKLLSSDKLFPPEPRSNYQINTSESSETTVNDFNKSQIHIMNENSILSSSTLPPRDPRYQPNISLSATLSHYNSFLLNDDQASTEERPSEDSRQSASLASYFQGENDSENYVPWDALEDLDAQSQDSSQKSTPMTNPIINIHALSSTSSSNLSPLPSTSSEYIALAKEHSKELDGWVPGFDEAVDSLLRSVQPHESQIQFRVSAMTFLKKLIRLSLGSLSYDISFLDVRTFLPADPLKLTIVLSAGQASYWHTSLTEKLKSYIESGLENLHLLDDQSPLSSPKAGSASSPVIISDDGKVILNHNLRNVSFVNENHLFKVISAVDALDVEISINNRYDLCSLTFFEEVASLVGQEQLFKRSMLLIRSWWFYETAAYAKTPIKHYLSDMTIIMILVGVFNRYHRVISTPLQALVFFLKDLASYDGQTQCLSIHGPLQFQSASSNLPNFMYAYSNHDLITPDIIEKYWQLYNLQDFNLGSENLSSPRPPIAPAVRQQMLINSMSKAIQKFERYGFNVLHPFAHVNMIQEKLSSRRIGLLTKVFQTSYESLRSLLISTKDLVENSGGSYSDLTKTFFPSIISRFSNPWRPDALNNSIMITEGQEFSIANNWSLLDGNITKLMQHVLYCNFIVESVISESAILTFCMDILTNKGPLPAGEVGKLLSEASTIPNLSHKLREKFGGLKKFLERYPELFSFSNDHPFNPHVILRSTLSTENLELIDRGIFPVHLISKSARANNKGKSGNTPTQSTKTITSGPIISPTPSAQDVLLSEIPYPMGSNMNQPLSKAISASGNQAPYGKLNPGYNPNSNLMSKSNPNMSNYRPGLNSNNNVPSNFGMNNYNNMPSNAPNQNTNNRYGSNNSLNQPNYNNYGRNDYFNGVDSMPNRGQTDYYNTMRNNQEMSSYENFDSLHSNSYGPPSSRYPAIDHTLNPYSKNSNSSLGLNDFPAVPATSNPNNPPSNIGYDRNNNMFSSVGSSNSNIFDRLNGNSNSNSFYSQNNNLLSDNSSSNLTQRFGNLNTQSGSSNADLYSDFQYPGLSGSGTNNSNTSSLFK